MSRRPILRLGMFPMRNTTRTPTINLVQFPLEIWEHIFNFLPEHDVIVLTSVCDDFQRIIQRMKPSFNLEFNYHVNMHCLLNYALSITCTSVNIDHCYWLKPKEILQIISKTKLQHFYHINCDVNEDVMRAICNLHLQSLSFTYGKKWKRYFEEHRKKSAVFLGRLIALKILVSDDSVEKMFFDVYKNVLQYCEQLQDLMISLAGRKYFTYFIDSPPTIPFTEHSKSLMPKLKRLVIRIDYCYPMQDVVCEILNRYGFDTFSSVKFLRAILKNKVIPLEHVDFGPLNCHLLKVILNNFTEGIRHHPLIFPENKALLLTNFDSNFCQLADFLDDESLIRQTSYKTICLEHIQTERFDDFANKIISNSGKSIEKLYLRGSAVLENILSGIQLFALRCVQITELDLTIVNWLEARERVSYLFQLPEIKCSSYSTLEMEKNAALLEVLTNFKNLQKLWISPWLLQCLYHSPRDSKITIREMPFWKMTKACEQLRELYIMCPHNNSFATLIHENSLYAIAHCKNLRVLYLKGFCIRTNAEFLLSPIAEGCPQLEELTLAWKFVLRDLQRILPICTFDKTFNFLKKLKKLCIYRNLPIQSPTVIHSLCQCTYLEKLMLTLKGESSIQAMLASLPNFENLHLFCVDIEGPKKQFQHMCSVIRKIHDKKPTFYGVVYGARQTFKTLDGSFHVEDYIEGINKE